VYPLVIQRGIGKHVDAVLIHLNVVAAAYFFAEERFKVLIAVDDDGAHIRMTNDE
jgi:hypothetical protein